MEHELVRVEERQDSGAVVAGERRTPVGLSYDVWLLALAGALVLLVSTAGLALG